MTTATRHEFAKLSLPGRRYHKIAIDLDRAWSFAHLYRYDARILRYIREKTWGTRATTSEAGPCRVNASHLAKEWRVARQNVAAALAKLVEDGMVIQEGDGYRIGKDVWSWSNGRIDPEDIQLAIEGEREESAASRASYEHAVRRVLARHLASRAMQPPPAYADMQPPPAYADMQPPHGQPCNPRIPGHATPAYADMQGPPRAIEEAPASEEIKKTPEDHHQRRDDFSEGGKKPGFVPAFEGDEPFLPPASEAPEGPMPGDDPLPWLVKASALAASNDETFAMAAYQVSRDFLLGGEPPDAVAAFSGEAIRQRMWSGVRLRAYLRKCLASYRFGDKIPPFVGGYVPAPRKTAPPPEGYYKSKPLPPPPSVPFRLDPELVKQAHDYMRNRPKPFGIREEQIAAVRR